MFRIPAQVRGQRFVVLPMEDKIRRYGLQEHTKASRARARERAFKAHSRRPDARHHNTTGHQLKKLVKPEVRRTAVAYLIASYAVAAVRACGLIGMSRSFGGYDVAEALDRLIDRYGKPKTIKSDNGAEFRSRYMEKWSKARGITLEFTSPGKPTENGQIESFNGTMRNEILRGVEFESVREARDELEKWREKYNNERPHSALNYEPPSTRRPHGGDGKENRLESINPINNNINQVNLLP